MKRQLWRFVFPALALWIGAMLCGCGGAASTQTPREAIESGWQYYILGEFKMAIRDFEHALRNTMPGDPEHEAALYGLASVWNLRRPDQNPELATQYYNRIHEVDPRGSDFDAWAALALARMKHLVPVGEDPDYDAVRKAYEEAIEKYPDHIAAEEAFLYLQATYLQNLDVESAKLVIRNVREFIENNPRSKFISPCYSILANAYDVLPDPENRFKYEVLAYETAEIDPNNPFQDNSWRYWTLATLAEFEVGDFETARAFYRKLLEEYPQDIRKYSANQALERMDRVEREIREALKEGGS